MKTEEQHPAEGSIDSSQGSRTNGVGRAQARDSAGVDAASASAQAAREPALPRHSRILRILYWTLWFGIVPVTLGCLVIWAISPAGGAEGSGAIAWIQSLVRSQPVPVGIVLFTAFEIAFWGVRHRLPLATHAHPPLRDDLPARLRAAFERAQSLIDEAEAILATRAKAVSRELSAKQLDRLREELALLRETMNQVPFDEGSFIDALARADGEVDIRLGRWRRSEVREYAEAILMAVAVAFGLRALVIEAFKIPSGSMIPTLMVGDHIFVSKFAYGPAIPFTHSRFWSAMPPRRGDVIVFAYPEHPEQDFIKRVIAIEGDKLEAREGHPFINGWEVPSCRVGTWGYEDYDSATRHTGDLVVEYLGKESYLTFYDRAGYSPDYQGPFFVKKGEVWVMGDNRNNSHDSRTWFGGRGGGAPYENIRGRALFVWLSVGENGVDWSRFGDPVMGRPLLPPSASDLRPAFDRCLKNRPAITTPPSGL